MDALRSSSLFSRPATSGGGDIRGHEVIRVKALVVGAGPVGLFAARQLEGLQLYHNESLCNDSKYKTSVFNRKVLVHDMPPGGHHASTARMLSGQKLASLYNKAAHSYEPCLECCINREQKVDWMMCSDEPAGGSWNSYLPTQQTLSDFHDMGLPDYPIEKCNIHRIPLPQPPQPCKREVTDGESLVRYYRDYGEKMLTESRVFSGKVVSASQAGSVWEDGLFWKVVVREPGGDGDKQIQCDYLLLAVGKKEPKWLNISGERDNSHVSHWTHDACRAMDKLEPGRSVLVVGNGFSACDTIYEAWQRKIKVVHLLPSKVKEEAISVGNQPGRRGRHALIQHLNLKTSERHYHVARALGFPDEYSEMYEQGENCTLVGINNSRECHIVQTFAGRETKHFHYAFDHIALLTGAVTDYSFFSDPFKSSLFSTDGLLNICPETMETKACKNLFIIGFSAGETFLSNALGHAVSAVETIRKREQGKLTQMIKSDEITAMECD